MQILKKYNRDKIISSAEKEFLLKGYKKTSMRVISEKAQMTVGNIYRYYKSKEELFGTIINPLYVKLTDMKAVIQEKTPDFKGLINWIKELQGQFRKEWVILFNGSSGTRFEKTVTKMEKVLQESLKTALVKNNKSDELAQPLTTALMTGMNTILTDKEKDTKKTAENFIDYIVSGLA